MNLKKDKTVAVVIDVQERLLPAMFDKDILVKNIIKLMKGLNILDVPIIYTQQYTKGLGMTTSSIMSEKDAEDFGYIEKLTFSCVGESEFMRQLDKGNYKNIIIAGIETHICVMQTVRDLLAEKYNVILAYDCISSRKLLDKEMGMKRMVQEGAFLGTYESILFELTQIAGTEEFKSISALIK